MCNLFLEGDLEMLKKAIISGIVISSILLAGCNGEQNEEQAQTKMTEVESEQEVVVAPKSEENDKVSNLLSELKDEIMVSITEQTEIESESIAIMLDGGTVEGSIEVSCSVGLPKDAKIDDTMIQQIVEDSIKKVSETENIAISEEKITINIEKN